MDRLNAFVYCKSRSDYEMAELLFKKYAKEPDTDYLMKRTVLRLRT